MIWKLSTQVKTSPDRQFVSDARGSVAILSALLLSALALAMAMALETSNLYVARLQNQRAADLGNLAAAATPSPIVDGVASPVAIATAAQVAGINGMAADGVVTSSTPAPDGSSRLALRTQVVRQMPALFPGLIGTTTSNTVGATSIASLTSSSNDACIASLLGPTNIYGSSSVVGPACGISAKTYLHVCGTATVSVAKASVGYTSGNEAGKLCSGPSLSPDPATFGYNATTTDTIAGTPGILGIRKHFAAMADPGWPYGQRSPRSLLNPPVSAGKAQTYSNEAATLPQDVKYGALTLTDATLTFSGGAPDPTCASPTTISGNLLLNGTNTLTFADGCYVFAGYVLAKDTSNNTFAVRPGAAATFVFKQYITNGGGILILPDATYSFAGSINNTNGGSLTIGAGTKVFGAAIDNGTGTLTLLAGDHYVNGGTITNRTGSMSFGNGRLYLWGGGINNASSGTLTYGDGPFYFYGGTVINETGRLIFGNGPFFFQGGSLTLKARSTTRFGVGNIDFYGGTISMAGESTIFGYGGSAVTGSSTVSLYGGSLSLTTQNLTAIGVTFAFQGGTISLLGVGTINATAPTGANPTYGYRNILIVVFGGAFNLYQSAGALDTMSGLIYVPVSNASLYGNQTVDIPPGGCFQLVAGVVDIYQRAKLNVAPCQGLTVGSDSLSSALLQ